MIRSFRLLVLTAMVAVCCPVLGAQWTDEFEVVTPNRAPAKGAKAVEVVGIGTHEGAWQWSSPDIAALKLTRCVIDGRVLEQLDQIPALVELHLNDCTGLLEASRSKTAWNLAGKLKLLRVHGGDAKFALALVFAGRAEVERFQYYNSTFGASYESLTPQDLNTCLSLPHLKELGLGFVNLPEIERVNSDFAPKVEAVGFYECEGLSDDWLAKLKDFDKLRRVLIGFRSPDRMRAKYPRLSAKAIVRYCLRDSLESLVLDGVNCDDQTLLLTRVSQLKHLRHLHLRNFVNVDLTPVVEIATRLESMDLSATEVPPEMLASLLMAIGPNCEKLWLEDAEGSQILSNVSVSRAIEELVRRSPKLSVLVLCANAALPVSLIEAVVGSKRLKVLHLKGVSGDAIDAVAALIVMPNLVTLGLYDCAGFTDEVLHSDPPARLQNLSLTGAAELTDEALGRFLLQFRSLQRLDVRRCIRAGASTMAALEQLPLLATAILYDTGIGTKAVDALKAKRPWMDVVHR